MIIIAEMEFPVSNLEDVRGVWGKGMGEGGRERGWWLGGRWKVGGERGGKG